MVMIEYDLIVIGTGSGMELATAFLHDNHESRIAVVEKDEPGGICLTRGCIPSKLLIYPADLVRQIQRAKEFGIYAPIEKIDSSSVLERMRNITQRDIDMIRSGLTQTKNIDYYTDVAEFVSPYTLKVGDKTISAKKIFLSIGSAPFIPKIEGIEEAGYLTSDTILKIKELPKSVAIIGGGYIAAEFGHFLSAMGCTTTIIGRNPQFIPEEEPEISNLAKKEMQKQITILTGHEVVAVEKTNDGKKKLTTVETKSKEEKEIIADEILVAVGRKSNADILHPEKSGIKTDKKGFIEVNEYLQTSKSNIWAIGDANGKYMFKHVANYESQVVFYNAILKEKIKADYHAVPHAVFCEPEIASVGLKEKEATEKFGVKNLAIGFQKFEETAKGEAMNLKDEFVKVILDRKTRKILGAHIIGPQASVLIQEIVNLMYTKEQNDIPLVQAMHIHPALSEVVARACTTLMTPEQYHHLLTEHLKLL